MTGKFPSQVDRWTRREPLLVALSRASRLGVSAAEGKALRALVEAELEACDAVLTTLDPPPEDPGMAAITGTDGDMCCSDPPLRADDPASQWGDCWCTRPENHEGDCLCEPCAVRHGMPGWPHQGPQDVVVELTREEFTVAARRALGSVGVTYRELADQAVRHAFDSAQAQMVWTCLGDTLPLDFE